MHPVITQAIAAERTREIRAYAAAAGRGRLLRNSRRSRHMLLAADIPGSGHSQTARPASRPLRDPRAV
jgi:hypothetical protein